MRLEVLDPSPPVAAFVRLFWLMDASANLGAPTITNRVIPNGTTQLIVHWGQPFVELLPGEPARFLECAQVQRGPDANRVEFGSGPQG